MNTHAIDSVGSHPSGSVQGDIGWVVTSATGPISDRDRLVMIPMEKPYYRQFVYVSKLSVSREFVKRCVTEVMRDVSLLMNVVTSDLAVHS
jgi:hypothetical protein